MDVTTAIRTRYSVRAYRSEPVPENTIRKIIEIARLSPSNSNTQPWHIAIVSGDARMELERRILNTQKTVANHILRFRLVVLV